VLKINNYLIIALLISSLAMAQEKQGQWIKGKAISDSLVAIGVSVVNLVNEQTAVTDGNGEFRIMVNEDDMLVFPSVNYEYKRRIITADDIKKGEITVNLTVKVTQLEEVVVNRDINPESLGLVPKGQKRYTRAERHVFSAQSGPVDALINAINGRTKMLKKVVEVEKQEALMKKLMSLIKEEYIVEKLKIPHEYIKAFQYYAIEDKEMIEALNAKNKSRVKLAAIQLAPQYLKLLREEAPAETEKRE
jgi:hypothetical protein